MKLTIPITVDLDKEIKSMKYYSEKQVKELLKEQRLNCCQEVVLTNIKFFKNIKV